MHYQQWDADKYQNLGQMLVTNNRQALKIIEEESQPLHTALEQRNITADDLERYIKEEDEYLDRLRSSTGRVDFRAVAYVEQLQKVRTAQ